MLGDCGSLDASSNLAPGPHDEIARMVDGIEIEALPLRAIRPRHKFLRMDADDGPWETRPAPLPHKARGGGGPGRWSSSGSLRSPSFLREFRCTYSRSLVPFPRTSLRLSMTSP